MALTTQAKHTVMRITNGEVSGTEGNTTVSVLYASEKSKMYLLYILGSMNYQSIRVVIILVAWDLPSKEG